MIGFGEAMSLLAFAGELVPAANGTLTWDELAELILFGVVRLGVVTTVVAILLCFLRLMRGPTLIDRGLAVDVISFQVVALTILLTIALRTLLYFDAVLIVAIMGFAGTVAFAQFVGRRRSAT